MGWFTGRKRQVLTVRVVSGNPRYAVQIPAAGNGHHGYRYTWDLPHPPAVGQWVWLKRDDRRKPWMGGVVAAEWVPAASAGDLLPVVGVASADEIAAEIRKRARENARHKTQRAKERDA